jgi:hypothetical protein
MGIQTCTYEVTGDWFYNWPEVLSGLDSTLSIEVLPADSKYFRSQFTDGRVGQVIGNGGRIAISPISYPPSSHAPARHILLLLPGAPLIESDRLLQRVGQLLDVAGARLLSDEEVWDLGQSLKSQG